MLTDLNADLGIYAQDKWTLRRLTVTAGVRFDYFNTGIPAQSAPASTWVGARSFDPLPDVPNWKDISPRVGVAYDLFGNGKTAIKASASRYVTAQVYAFASQHQSIGDEPQQHDAHLARLQRRFHSPGRPAEHGPAAARRVLRPGRPELRQVGHHDHDTTRT